MKTDETSPKCDNQSDVTRNGAEGKKTQPHSCRRLRSRFFDTAPDSSPKPAKFPGAVPSIRFPPLTADRFGLIQEELADDPFRLLVAVTFLIKTSAKAAIPVFRKVTDRFGSPLELADPENEQAIKDMIRDLGMVNRRYLQIRKFAEGWLYREPRKEVRFRVRNYSYRESDPPVLDDYGSDDDTDLPAEDPDSPQRVLEHVAAPASGRESRDDPPKGSSSSHTATLMNHHAAAAQRDYWEIGHLTQGPYAIDSWRIFCRDILRGLASDFNGSDAATTFPTAFQPEWMRVMPRDKELRAFLRWMWMREGWEWDPETADRKVLGAEMMRAANEGRVVYAADGGLKIAEVGAELELSG